MDMALSVFSKCSTLEQSKEIANEVLSGIQEDVIFSKIQENEEYWKIDGWFVVRCYIKCKDEMNEKSVRSITSKISDKWEWAPHGFNATADVRPPLSSKFKHSSIRFCSVIFEDEMDRG
ncbi:hypothetical protein [Saccharibacillus sp. JS10]|uniref:hypothetical protein n=1 Tax=Saccharibacillus sp. JS10 TaxID=2950552 RepID=UPI0021086C39|nr:hypothetical protein [Saccharibacillus sp. JS10]MCQ4087535.1 hypothetical protein [Saccharibacillus sp. JS10]